MHNFSFKQLTTNQKKLRKRILELSFQSNLSHLGSCLTAIDLIDGIYKTKKVDEKFILSNGHAGIALYTVLEKYNFIKNDKTIKKMMIHPDRNLKYDIQVSTGSLGQGLPIALGMAIADKTKNVYCMISDGECAEGSIWETLRVAYEKKIYNLKIVLNANGWAAYDTVDLKHLRGRIKSFGYSLLNVNGHNSTEILTALKKNTGKKQEVLFAQTEVEQFPFLKGQDAHYYIMDEGDYTQAIKLLS